MILIKVRLKQDVTFFRYRYSMARLLKVLQQCSVDWPRSFCLIKNPSTPAPLIPLLPHPLSLPVKIGLFSLSITPILCSEFSISTKVFSNHECICIISAFNYSGGYYNPVLATGLKWGCKGHSHMEFGIVYWVGASIGAIASIYVYPIIKSSLGIKAKTE